MHTKGLNYIPVLAKLVFGGAEMVFHGLDLNQIGKMAPQRVKSGPGTIELNDLYN